MTEQETLCRLASEWMEIANRPVMKERKSLWGNLNAKQAKRPMVLVETCLMFDYVSEDELYCEDEFLRGIEKFMLWNVRHAKEVGDDFVLEPYFRLPWVFDFGDFGVDVPERTTKDAYGDELAVEWGHPISTPDDARGLHERVFSVDRETSQKRCDLLNDYFGDILPVRLEGIDPVFGDNNGFSPFTGLIIPDITLNLFRFIGMNNLYLWLYDYPDEFKRVMKLLTKDFAGLMRFLEDNELLADNNNNALTGGRYGYLEGYEAPRPVKAKDLWVWLTFEETTVVSPEFFSEFILPCAKAVSEIFGKVYYGCCENLDRRYLDIKREVKNLEAVSVAPFTDLAGLCEMLEDDVILSYKPHPAHIAGVHPDWVSAKDDVEKALNARKSPNLEFIMRDVYRTYGNRKVLSDWVSMTRAQF